MENISILCYTISNINTGRRHIMNSTPETTQLFECIKQLSDAAVEKLLKMALDALDLESTDLEVCPYCGGSHFVRYGKKQGKQRFFCKDCKRTFVTTTHTLMSMSHQPVSVWKEVLTDTINGDAIDYTAKCLGLSHQCVFNMRHKILLALQDIIDSDPVILEQVSELDETFVLECYKGKELPPDVDRPARKHGAKAQKRGISNEYICINTGVQRGGGAVAETVNRAKPSRAELEQVYCGHIGNGSLILCDGLSSYKTLGMVIDCTVHDINAEETGHGFYNLNTVNNFHSYIKKQYNEYRGVATKYLNRYNAMFTLAWRKNEAIISGLCARLLKPGLLDYHHTIRDIRKSRLLTI